KGPGLRRDRRLPLAEERRVNEAHADRELPQCVDELGDRAAVELRRGHDLVARLQERQEGHELRRHAAGRGDGPGRAFCFRRRARRVAWTGMADDEIEVVYRLRADPSALDARVEALLLEQTVE